MLSRGMLASLSHSPDACRKPRTGGGKEEKDQLARGILVLKIQLQLHLCMDEQGYCSSTHLPCVCLRSPRSTRQGSSSRLGGLVRSTPSVQWSDLGLQGVCR